MLLGRLRRYGNVFWWCCQRPRSVADVSAEIREVQLSLTIDNVLDTSPSCPRRCWDVPIAYDDMETKLYRMHWDYNTSKRKRSYNLPWVLQTETKNVSTRKQSIGICDIFKAAVITSSSTSVLSVHSPGLEKIVGRIPLLARLYIY